jgi:metal-responsive CopG/Arc/MetJ family transcriptional regulator
MPRSYPPRRTLVGVRLSAAGLAAIDAQAKAEGVDRSETIRRLLAEALAARQWERMPKWSAAAPPREGAG